MEKACQRRKEKSTESNFLYSSEKLESEVLDFL